MLYFDRVDISEGGNPLNMWGKKMKKKYILVLSCAKFIVEFVSVVGFFILSIYLYGKMIFLIAHRFLFSSVRPLATTM